MILKLKDKKEKGDSAGGTEHGYRTAALLAGGLATNPPVNTDFLGLKQLQDKYGFRVFGSQSALIVTDQIIWEH